MSIQDLSFELLEQIIDRVPADHANLRAVCRSLNFAITPSFFSSLFIDVHRSRLEVGLSHLEALATGKTPWSQFAHTLRIKNLSPSLSVVVDVNKNRENDSINWDDLNLAEDRMEQCLPPALESLKNVQTVLWTFTGCSDESRWTPEAIHDFMASLPQLETFSLTADETSFSRNYDCDFDRLTGLRNLTLASSDAMSLGYLSRSLSRVVSQNPGLRSLHLQTTTRHWGHPPLNSFAELFHTVKQPLQLTELRMVRCSLRVDHSLLPHLRFLRCLWLFGGDTSLWDRLREEGIRLSEICTDWITEGLLEYLSSYSGLEQLTVTCADAETAEESNRRTDKFFNNALPHHAQSLVSLSCRGDSKGRWSFGTHNIGALSLLHKLNYLRMNVNSVLLEDDIIKIETDSEGRTTVHRFLDLVNQLPITDAAIMPSFPLQHASSTRSDVEHSFIREIDAAVRDFKSQDGHVSAAVVLAGSNYYRMEGGDGRYCAVESANPSWPQFYRGLLENPRERTEFDFAPFVP
ncbi:hypothetical protein C8R45DRAFT_144428 [Mycena sanguinolenta]|nr:hypothetical protein C8R45DRAFT_144428 [Mycena sanguinolenta]